MTFVLGISKYTEQSPLPNHLNEPQDQPQIEESKNVSRNLPNLASIKQDY